LGNFSLAWRSFWSVLGSGKLPDEVLAELGVAKPVAVAPPAVPASPAVPAAAKEARRPEVPAVPPDESALQLMALLQREGRLLDFLYEDLAPYTDERVGAVVRGVHEGCRKALDQVMQLAPVVDGVEGTVTTLAAAGVKASDTARLKLLGNVPPDGQTQGGILQHKGWQVKEMTLPAATASIKVRVVAPAEIEVE
jgi:hypothetical protein